MDISLVFAGTRVMKTLNKKWRGKDAPANVLAFPLTQELGEIIINPEQAQREANAYGISYTMRAAYLFVHGLLHLQGYDHETEGKAEEMERKEKKIMQVVKQ